MNCVSECASNISSHQNVSPLLQFGANMMVSLLVQETKRYSLSLESYGTIWAKHSWSLYARSVLANFVSNVPNSWTLHAAHLYRFGWCVHWWWCTSKWLAYNNTRQPRTLTVEYWTNWMGHADESCSHTRIPICKIPSFKKYCRTQVLKTNLPKQNPRKFQQSSPK